jgi:uncharacterized protein
MKNEDMINAVSQLSVPILKRNKVKYAAIFGSFVRSEENMESDIDFLLEYSEGVSMFDVIALKRELEEKLGRNVDLVSLKYLNKRIRERVLKEQVRIL